MKIVAIDPGLVVCGYAVVDAQCAIEPKLLEAGVFGTDSQQPLEYRLNQIAQDMAMLLDMHKPAVVAVEELYSHYAHPKTAILMGHARGVILQQAAAAQISIRGFSATRIKKSLTGNGRASKGQMQRSIQTRLGLEKMPEPADVADAIAIGLCASNSMNRNLTEHLQNL